MTSPWTAAYLATTLLIATLTAVSASAETTSPGRSSAYVTTPAFTVPGEGTKVAATVTLVRGVRRHVLEVDALLDVYSPEESTMYILLRANGVTVFGSDAKQDCRQEVACSIVATGWLDLDAAEQAHPGVFIGKPVLVEMIAGNANVTVPSATATLRARLQPK